MRNGVAFRWLAGLGLLFAVVAMGKAHPKHSAAAKKSLYAQLGGKPAITKLVDDFVKRCATDARIKRFFAATASNPKRLAHFKKSLVDQLCQASGGPCKYHGQGMAAAHHGMHIGGADFDAMMGDLRASLKHFKVSPDAQGKLLGMLVPMKGAIVSAGAPPTPVAASPASIPTPAAAAATPAPAPPRDTASDGTAPAAPSTPDSPPAPE